MKFGKVLLVLALITVVAVGCGVKKVESAVTDVDRRKHAGFPVGADIFTLSGYLTVNGLSTASTTIKHNGVARQIVIIAPDLSISSTVSVSLLNESGATLYSSSDVAESATTALRISEDTAPLLTGTTTVYATTKTTQENAVDNLFTVILYYTD